MVKYFEIYGSLGCVYNNVVVLPGHLGVPSFGFSCSHSPLCCLHTESRDTFVFAHVLTIESAVDIIKAARTRAVSAGQTPLDCAQKLHPRFTHVSLVACLE